MEIKQLRTFLKVADAKSFLKAADELYVTRQALAKSIDALEDELGVQLFFRTQKGAMMTPAGIYFYPKAASVVADFDKLKSETMSIKRYYKPVLKICMSIGIYDHFATPIHNYRVEHSSEMSVGLRCCLDTDAETILSEKKADAILSFTKPSETLANSVQIGESDIILLVSRESAMADRDVGINDLPKLLYNGGNDSPLWWKEKARRNDIISSDLNYLFSLLRKGKGTLPMPKIAVPEYLDFTIKLPAYPKPQPIPIYYSTLNATHYNALNYALLDDIFESVIRKNKIE